MSSGSNLIQVQAYNRRIVFDTIRLHGPISRADIARRTELTPQTVSNLVGELLRRQLVIATGQQPRQGGGKPSITLEVNPEGAYAIGVNIYLDDLSGVLVDLAGKVHGRAHHSIDSKTPDEALPQIAEIIHGFVQEQGLSREQLWGVGMGLPGPLHAEPGSALKPPDYSPWHKATLVDDLRRRLDLPIYLENNANAAAIGERWYGAGQTISDFIYVSFGMYLGGGIVVDGQIHRGVGGFAGELGDVPVLSSISAITDLGDYASPATLYKKLEAAGERISRPADLERLYREHHTQVIEWLDTAARHLAPALVTAEYFFDPEAFIFGGRLPASLLDHIISQLAQLTPRFRKPTKSYAPMLIRSNTGEDAAALGAATLPIYETLAPHPSTLLKQGRGDLGSPS